jgi:hypothetical protein
MPDVLQIKLESILAIAQNVQARFTLDSQIDDVRSIFCKVAATQNAILVQGLIACKSYPFMLIAVEPRKVLTEMIIAVRERNKESFQESFNPVTLRPQLGEKELLLTMNSCRVCYAIAAYPSVYLVKAVACQYLSSVSGYNQHIDQATMRFVESTIKEIHPQYDHQTAQIKHGGTVVGQQNRVDKFKKTRIQLRMEITALVIEFVRTTPAVSKGIIFVNNLEDSANAAVAFIVLASKYKDAVTRYLKQLIAEHYEEYTFKSYLDADFNVPYDFRMKKSTARIKNDKQCVCLLHMYNIAMYEPVPCIRQTIGAFMMQIAHPVVKLRLLYADLYFAEKNRGAAFAVNHARLIDVYKEILAWDTYPTWIGFYMSETFDKYKRNLNNSTQEHTELLLI